MPSFPCVRALISHSYALDEGCLFVCLFAPVSVPLAISDSASRRLFDFSILFPRILVPLIPDPYPLFRILVPLIPDPYPLFRILVPLIPDPYPLFRILVPLIPDPRTPYSGSSYPLFRILVPLIPDPRTPYFRIFASGSAAHLRDERPCVEVRVGEGVHLEYSQYSLGRRHATTTHQMQRAAHTTRRAHSAGMVSPLSCGRGEPLSWQG